MPVIKPNKLDEAPPNCPVVGFGYARFQKGKDAGLELHFHDCDEFWFIVEGAMRVQSEGKEYTVKTGEALYTPAGEEHTILEVLEDTNIVWYEGELKGRQRLGHLHRPEDPWP